MMHEQQAVTFARLSQLFLPSGLMSGQAGMGMANAGSKAAEEAGSQCGRTGLWSGSGDAYACPSQLSSQGKMCLLLQRGLC